MSALHTHTTRRWLLGIFLLALVLRAGLAWVHPFHLPDSVDYDHLAKCILDGQPYRVAGHDASRLPGYPVLIAGVYTVFGRHERAVLLVQAVLGAACSLLVFRLAKHGLRDKDAGDGQTVGLVAAGLAALDPLSIAFSASLLSESPFTFALLVILVAIQMLHARPTRWFAWLMLALAVPAALFLRGSILYALPVLLLWLMIGAIRTAARTPTLKYPLIQIAVGLNLVLFLTAATLLPWYLRNAQLFHSKKFRLSTLEGLSLYEAVYPEADGGPKQMEIPLPPEMRWMNDAQQSDEWNRRAWQHIRGEPGRMARLAVVKQGRFWCPWLNAGEFQNRLVNVALTCWHLPLYVLACLGLLRGKFSGKSLGLLLIPILYFALLHALFMGSVRYRVPLMPLLDLLAAAGIALVISRRTKVPGPRLPTDGSGVGLPS